LLKDNRKKSADEMIKKKRKKERGGSLFDINRKKKDCYAFNDI
jgi:hypothetical protein